MSLFVSGVLLSIHISGMILVSVQRHTLVPVFEALNYQSSQYFIKSSSISP